MLKLEGSPGEETREMMPPIRLLLATAEPECRTTMRALLDAALLLVPLPLELQEVDSAEELHRRVGGDLDDVILLDWSLAGAETPALVRDILQHNRRLRIVTLLPLQLRQYRQCIWEAGACVSIPKEHLDQEWLSGILCIIRRAMEREARLTLAHC
jgi:DNA-binding NarL/FixJ family response regulator